MDSIPIKIAAKIVEYPVHPILRQFDYLFDFTKNVRNLSEQAEKLKDLQLQVNRAVQRAETRGDIIEPRVETWRASVNDLLDQVRKIEEQSRINNNCFGGLCPNCICRYRLSRKSTKKASSIVELLEKGKFDRISHEAPLPGIEYFSLKSFIAFDSRKGAMDQIREALGEEECHVAVLHGTRGIGKTVMAKEVGKRAKKENMFDEVVMADVPSSKTPEFNTTIQGQIADMLGLKIPEQSESGRARRLYLRLKNEKRILIILDGVRGRLDLEAIGIPSASDHKGCKILITTENGSKWGAMEDDGVRKVEIRALTEEESWRLFASVAGEVVENPDFKAVAEEIVNKCMGLPLMIVTIGTRLRNKSIEEWKDARRIIGGLETKTANLDELLNYYV